MKRDRDSGHLAVWLGIGLASVFGAAGVGMWQIAPCDFQATSQAEKSTEIAVPYGEFRAMLVRNNATRAIVEHGGMQLVSEEMLDFSVDLSRDKRPLLNALLRKSKSRVSAQKKLVVAVNNDDIHADNLVLMQDAAITPESLTVTSISEGPAGDLKSYRTTLRAQPNGESTSVQVSVNIELSKKLSKLFHSEAQTRLNAAAESTVNQQCDALRQFAIANISE